MPNRGQIQCVIFSNRLFLTHYFPHIYSVRIIVCSTLQDQYESLQRKYHQHLDTDGKSNADTDQFKVQNCEFTITASEFLYGFIVSEFVAWSPLR